MEKRQSPPNQDLDSTAQASWMSRLYLQCQENTNPAHVKFYYQYIKISMRVCVSVCDGSGLVGTDNSDARPLYFTTTAEPRTL